VQTVDVAEHLEQLSEGILPNATCSKCKATLSAFVGVDQGVYRRLPARERDIALDKFLAKAHVEKTEKLEDCLVSRSTKPTAPSRGGSAWVAAALAVVVLGGGAAFGVHTWMNREAEAVTPPPGGGSERPDPKPPTPTIQRPDWIMSDSPATAFCHDLVNRLMCVGASSFRATREEGAAEAADTALEELANAIGLKVNNPYFKDNVLAGYSEARSKALGALQSADLDRSTPEYASAIEVVRKARKRVADVLQLSGRPAVPTQRSDWYWEEYKKEKGQGTEVLVFVRFDISNDELKALVDKYSASQSILGGTAMTVFPSAAWQHPELAGGVVMAKVGKQMSVAGIAPDDVITSVGDQKVADASALARAVQDKKTGALKLTVQTADAAPRTVEVVPK
jgi:hypothetical protein